jgi:hypothetical protein
MTDRGPVIAHDMAGDGLLTRDWVYDGLRVWEVLSVPEPGQLACRDPYRVTAEQVVVMLGAAAVAKVRADRADDPRYLRAVFEQALVLRDFLADTA